MLLAYFLFFSGETSCIICSCRTLLDRIKFKPFFFLCVGDGGGFWGEGNFSCWIDILITHEDALSMIQLELQRCHSAVFYVV